MNLFNVETVGGKGTNLSNSKLKPVRVADIVMSTDHPEYKALGANRAIGAIKYEQVNRPVLGEKNTEALPVAFPLHGNIQRLPLKNEIVLLVNAPAKEAADIHTNSEDVYYTDIVNVWGGVTSNPLYDIEDDNPNLGDFPDVENINPLQPYNGDLLIEGRFGQTLRLSGAQHPDNIYSNNDNDGKPFIILKNKQAKSNNSLDHINEDINKDGSSIYITSEHSVPLEEARTKAETYQVAPDRANEFKKDQVIINSGRLFFNARDEGIYFSAKDDFGVSAESVHIDGESVITLDAKKIHLGVKAMELEFEPVIKGDQLEMLLYNLLNELKQVGSAMAKAKTIKGHAIPTLNMEGRVLKKITKGLMKSINPGGKSELKSRKVFTE